MKKNSSKGSKDIYKASEIEELKLLVEKKKLQNELLQKIIDNIKPPGKSEEK